MPSVKKNFAYSALLVIANYVFPLITYPYVSRVLGVTNIGICNFVDSVINYFILFSMLGIETVGIREIARTRHDPEALNKTYSSLFLINTILTGIMLCSLVLATVFVPKLHEYSNMMFYGAFKLVFNYLLVEWLYKGLEDFRYITIRSLAVKFLFVVAVFVFVREQDDYNIFYLLSCLLFVLNALVNIIHSRKIVHFRFQGLEISANLKPVLILGLYAVLTSMYSSFNVTYLGFVSGETEVGYYTTATKLHSIIMALFTAFTNVLLPRMSALISEGNIDKFKEYFGKSVNALLSFSLPLVAWSIPMTPSIIRVLSGEGYEGAIIPMQIVLPLIVILGYAQILVIQTIMPLGKDRKVLYNSIVGAVFGLALNFILVPVLGAAGSAMVWLLTELVITILSQFIVTRELGLKFPLIVFIRESMCMLPLLLCVYLVRLSGMPAFTQVLVSGIVMAVYVLVYQLFLRKNDLFISMIEKWKQKVGR